MGPFVTAPRSGALAAVLCALHMETWRNSPISRTRTGQIAEHLKIIWAFWKEDYKPDTKTICISSYLRQNHVEFYGSFLHFDFLRTVLFDMTFSQWKGHSHGTPGLAARRSRPAMTQKTSSFKQLSSWNTHLTMKSGNHTIKKWCNIYKPIYIYI